MIVAQAIPTELPTSLLGLFIAIIVGQAGLVAFVVKAIMGASLRQNERAWERVTATQDKIAEHLDKSGHALSAMQSRLDTGAVVQIDSVKFMAEQRAAIEFIKSAIVSSTIVPPGTRMTGKIEPAAPEQSATMKELAAREEA
jgi:hypothetical protein